jgi:hypothetical protein
MCLNPAEEMLGQFDCGARLRGQCGAQFGQTFVMHCVIPGRS